MKFNLGAFIREKRNEKGLTLTELGGLIHVDSGALSRIENGKQLIDKKALPFVAKVFNLNLDELRDEYFSEKIALEIFKNRCSEKIHRLIEEKVKIIKDRNHQQGRLEI